ncbi:MAG: Pyridoxine/pyridoxamine 5'-phosphate oxidase [Thermoleophilia bacterium]|nr:Pyridoxine/pyridoxamine 5'-phosphate oxidase [Thermoleophilia bacterium]
MDEHDLADDPIAQLHAWLAEAREAVPQAEAMTLATADSSGRPSARIVLLGGIDERGLTFFTNRASRKGEELRENPRAAVVLHWWELGRQVRVEGAVEEVDEMESAAYWSSRPRASQIAAWASPQTQPLASRSDLEARVAEAEQRFDGSEIPLPPSWGGYRLVPESIEFWAHRDNRLHDRIRFVRSHGGWSRERLAP